MAFSTGSSSIEISDITSRVSDADILAFYLGITKIPCVINSPLRKDTKPSFGLYSSDGIRVYYTDLSKGDKGGVIDLLEQMWNCSYKDTLIRVYNDISKMKTGTDIKPYSPVHISTMEKYDCESELECKVRDWKPYDIEYWNSYGISLEWLKYAEVYPISHKIIIKNSHRYVLSADKLAYAFVEHKEGKVTLKIYQPYNTNGYKWASNVNRSVWSLWTKIPKTGNNLIITSSLKDSLNLWANLNIPAICLQGEGYLPKPQVIQELKNRYKNIIVFYDNDYTNPDNPGRTDSIRLSEEYSLKRVEIPEKYEVKDPSDCYKKYGKEKYLQIMKEIFKNKTV